jgi:adenylate cyclase
MPTLANFFIRYGLRTAISLLPVLLALGHATGLVPIEALVSLDNSIYDTKLRWTMPKTLDPRIVIVDIDDKSLAEVGRWPWSTDKLARLSNEVMQHQKPSVLAFDLVFSEKDDDDAQFALSLKDQNIVLGYHFHNDRTESVGSTGRRLGQLPKPIHQENSSIVDALQTPPWLGFTANIELLANAAPQAGFLNVNRDADGVVRSAPLRAAYQAEQYESLALALYRLTNKEGDKGANKDASKAMPSEPDTANALLIPFRGLGGPHAGSFQYVSAADLLANRLPPEQLKGKIVLIGSSVHRVQDLYSTPVGAYYPSVEIQANALSSMLDDHVIYKPAGAWLMDAALLVVVGLFLAIALPQLPALKAFGLSLGVMLVAAAVNLSVFRALGMVLPLAALLVMTVLVYLLSRGYGYCVEKRTQRNLTQLLGSYVPPQLVEKMLQDPDSHVMKATNKELTVMFCDLRGFTQLGQDIPPTQLQHLLNDMFSRLSHIILQHHGTVDKYMGDCIMAFWGAPDALVNHAELAVKAALAIIQEVKRINVEHQAKHLPAVRLGIGINTGVMCVGDMGSSVRRSYTVVGDAVNVAARLESLTKTYKLDLLAGFATTLSAPMFDWVLIDTVQLSGKTNLLATYTVKNYTKT